MAYSPMARRCLYRPGDPTPWNVHLDIAPWEYATDSPSLRKTAGEMQYERLEAFRHENNAVTASDGRAVQGLINLVDNCAADGGTLVVPQFHRHFDTWLESQGEGAFAPGVTFFNQEVAVGVGAEVVVEGRAGPARL